MIKIGKYKFNTKEQFLDKVDALGTATDEDGNEYPTHGNVIVELGYEVLEDAVYGVNEETGEFEVISEAVYSDKYLVDVLWKGDEIKVVEQDAVLDEEGNVITPEVVSYDHPYGWKSYSVEVEENGMHSFLGLDYQSLKF